MERIRTFIPVIPGLALTVAAALVPLVPAAAEANTAPPSVRSDPRRERTAAALVETST